MNQDITNVVQSFFAAVDACDWDAAGALMTNPFHLDYSSFGAGPAADLAPADILSGWKGVLPGFDATQHHLGPLNIEVNGDSAVVRASVIATHQIAGAEGGDLWTVHGSYELRLTESETWQLSGNVFNFKFLNGNTELPAMAASGLRPRESQVTQLTVIVNVEAKSDQIEAVTDKLLSLIAPTRAEVGCISFTLHQNTENPRHFFFFELWESRALWLNHMNTKSFAAYKESIGDMISDINFHEMAQIA